MIKDIKNKFIIIYINNLLILMIGIHIYYIYFIDLTTPSINRDI